ncbi:ABC transporter substrate-binding protein [Bradyrhizobium sp. U87765 SZCCT0131]|uniref:ABC transporter substrate-binding protein n=1 Tax=unclassified Bradyrhizobium TaxID=2631580 RepID=UPI001BABD649|nr:MULTISPECIES: ABC transporter substrate-binding protein [unclassified Bradyrhizobium]MBR1219052.1 ABC transporter substrate-binding protein [Bradyrhizobium sp. U87765 SZCCT0131]MBR1261703.1 ABC transporter substrate-binding protein [Bradyrhizobium sp. U87765 SZCCT0134]MBR1306444.1 ABC transporter substrate-binding protein [Bradyrhizobium sp. U87765 SZCCT0110]MBR1317485.1 ABC transporter substrate-binding protein [Bradyrhizobium sp. U87765 SZCCT0109]MBR1351187.1 ABC transporter substrate-bin
MPGLRGGWGFRGRAAAGLAALLAVLAPAASRAADGKLTIGVVLPMSGAFADQGQHYDNGIKLYQKLHGTTVAGLTVETVVRDDQGPGSGDLARRLTQELIVRNKADVILGYSFTPNAMAAASLLTEAKKPAVIVNAATSVITEKSPYFVRASFTLPQLAASLGRWAARNGIKTAYTIVSDYAPGIDAETWFKQSFEARGGKVIGDARTPVSAMEYAPFLQRAMEAKPDAVFAFNPGGDVSVAFMKSARERGLTKAGIKLMVTGDVVDDNLLPAMGDAVDGVISTLHYQVDLENRANAEFLKGFREMFGATAVPSYRVVQGYDATAMIYKAVEKTKGNLDAAALMEAFKGMTIDSPRGPMSIDPATRDVVQNIYIRQGQLKDGVWRNVAIDSIEDVKDPAK